MPTSVRPSARPSCSSPSGSKPPPGRSWIRTPSSIVRLSGSTNTSGNCSTPCASWSFTTGCGRTRTCRCRRGLSSSRARRRPPTISPKFIIKFINNLAGTIDGDPATHGRLQGRVSARIQRDACRAADPRQRRVQPDLHGGLRGQRHEQHEVHDERGAHDRHARRRHDRDGRGSGRGELLPVRLDGRASGRQPRLVQSALALRTRTGNPRGVGSDFHRPL